MEGTICPSSLSSVLLTNASQEGETGQIVLYKDEPETAIGEADLVKWVMHYLYHLDYLEPESQGKLYLRTT
jgi:hypothetical protein